MKISVHVGAGEFSIGIKRSPVMCAFALAVGKALPDKFVSLNQIGIPSEGTYKGYQLRVYDKKPGYIIIDPSTPYGYVLIHGSEPQEPQEPEMICMVPDYVSAMIRAFDKSLSIPDDVTFTLDLIINPSFNTVNTANSEV